MAVDAEGYGAKDQGLDRLIARMKTLPGVWFPTCEEVARHCIDRHPPRAGAL